MEKLKLYASKDLEELRNLQDPLADKAVKPLIDRPNLIDTINEWKKIPAQLPGNFPTELASFFEFYQSDNTLLELPKILASQSYFAREGNKYLALLGLNSLPYCYAFADGAQVLARSKRILNHPGERLLETAWFVVDSFKPGAFLHESGPLLSIAKVRLIHAISRYFIKNHDRGWNPSWGLPINQEDMLGTNLAFSLMVFRGLRKMGKPLSKDIAEALLHYWKIIGHYLGLEIKYWPENMAEASYLEKAIRKRHLKASAEGQILMKNLLSFYEMGKQPFAPLSKYLVRYFLGPEISDCLKISQGPIPENLTPVLLNLSFTRPFYTSSHQKLAFELQKQAKEIFGRTVQLSLPKLT
ncbi:oxygenase MpaB family protein [Litoribacter populi]|uniref:oxygenase MpaB family protein n=1 Tax=Litoribacter populi TaxID=2598460 RepID=UPI00117C4535|nr:oxygenase MpaB family protein [Litoribacter populi]